jgi:serine beta-lactamase-like protein LACTB
VDDQQIVWSKGFGFADTVKKIPATAETVYRVGSVSKLFTDIAVMQLVEQGKLDLDAPVTRYLPDFKPRNPFGRQITLRQLMSHRSGLVREPPVGNYFETTEPTLEQTIASLNDTTLVYSPETRTKYSNAGIATVGYVLERLEKRPYAKYVKTAVLDPLEMTHSGLEPTTELKKQLAKAYMWTLDGRTFEAPTFQMGIDPSGSLYTTVNDLRPLHERVVRRGTWLKGLDSQTRNTRADVDAAVCRAGQKTGYGMGFSISEMKRPSYGRPWRRDLRIRYDIEAMPDDKLGVVVVTTKDAANAVSTRIADVAL